MIEVNQMLLHTYRWFAILILLCLTVISTVESFNQLRDVRSAFALHCKTGSFGVGSSFTSPESVSKMMKDVAEAIIAARDAQVSLALVDVPVPVTGGTELDDWPGGIKQKYATLSPMIAETMRALNFKSSEISKREYLGGEIGEDDAVGIWSDLDQQVCICCFPTPDTIPAIIEYKKWTNINSIFVIINQQFFLDPLSKDESKTFLSSAEIIYRLESLNMRGPGALPVRGLLYRQYPHQFKAARRLDKGGYVLLNSYETKPLRDELETLYMEDSKIRDKNLSLLDRLKKQVPNFGN